MKATEKKPLMVRLDPRVHTALKVRAAREGTSVQAIVEDLIAKHLLARRVRYEMGGAHAAR